MNSSILIGTQITSLFIMIGTADKLFTCHISTLMFIAALVVFIRSSIYIGENSDWLLRECQQKKRSKASRYYA